MGSPIQIPMVYFSQLNQRIPRFVWDHKSPQITKAILEKEEQSKGIMLPDFNLHYKVRIIKTVWQ